MEKESHITYLFYHDALLSLNRSITESIEMACLRGNINDCVHKILHFFVVADLE